AKMVGYPVTELLNMKSIDLVSPEDRDEAQYKILSEYDKPYKINGLKKNGIRFPLEVHGKIFSYQGRQVRVTAIRDLTEQKKAEEEIKILRDILPICSFCKNIRNDEGYYEQIEGYIHKHSGVDFSHTICPQCMEKHYPEYSQKSD
ncbi:MAG: PAS domain S-box protein, partial [Bacteroidetes bacterium]|nr:PAS domain S-box protein [Bacteroidota bacterium]